MTSTLTQLKGTIQQYSWTWNHQEYSVTYETLGQGHPVLLLPAFSTVSTRHEMAGIAQILANNYQVFTLDWLGFGDSERPKLNYNPELYHQLLQDFVQATFTQPVVIIAAGHASGYALKLAQTKPNLVSKIILIAPTWCGPLKVMGLPNQVRDGVRETVRSPFLGQLLYYLNTTPSFLRLMYRRHVYTDASKLTPELIASKKQITQKTGSRYAPAAFVTGTLDPVESRTEFLAFIQSLSIPILVVIADNAPPKSKAEMEVMSEVSQVQSARLPGTLGLHEEFFETVTPRIEKFLDNH
jgi:pimeloyl-ACP methyl ester carboxylesterase